MIRAPFTTHLAQRKITELLTHNELEFLQLHKDIVMISPLELCHIVESGFLPLKCKCTIDAHDQMMVQIFDRDRGHADLLASGIPVSTLGSSRAIAALIGSMKEQLEQHETRRTGRETRQQA